MHAPSIIHRQAWGVGPKVAKTASCSRHCTLGQPSPLCCTVLYNMAFSRPHRDQICPDHTYVSSTSAAAGRILPSRLRHPLAPVFALASGCRFKPGFPRSIPMARAVGNMLQRCGRYPATPVRIREWSRIRKLHLEAGRSVAVQRQNSIFSFLLGAVCGIAGVAGVLHGLVGASMTLMHMVPRRA